MSSYSSAVVVQVAVIGLNSNVAYHSKGMAEFELVVGKCDFRNSCRRKYQEFQGTAAVAAVSVRTLTAFNDEQPLIKHCIDYDFINCCPLAMFAPTDFFFTTPPAFFLATHTHCVLVLC